MPSKPFFEAGAAEGVEAVEEGEGLIEEFGADLDKVLLDVKYIAMNKSQIPLELNTQAVPIPGAVKLAYPD